MLKKNAKDKPVQVGPRMVARMVTVDLEPIVAPPDMNIPNEKVRMEQFRNRQIAARNRVKTVIQEYRAELRKAFSFFTMAQAAGASIERYDLCADPEDEYDEMNPPPDRFNYRVIPHNDRAKQILAAATGQAQGAATAYELRQDILARNPHWYSRQWDSLRADIDKAWKAKDPEFTKANRGYLILNSRRGVNRFMNIGITFPRKVFPGGYGINHISHIGRGYSVRINLDHHGSMDFKLATLDARRAQVWRCVRDGVDGYIPGSAILNCIERTVDGKRVESIVLNITYWRLADHQELDPKRVLHVAFHPEPTDESFLFSLVTEDGQADEYRAAAVVAMLRQHKAKSDAVTLRRQACGSERQPWGHRKGWLKNQHHLSRITRTFANRKLDYNKCFARLIADRAKQWNCGVVRVVHPEFIYRDFSWSWYSLKQILASHACDRNFTLYFGEEAKPVYEAIPSPAV